MSYMQLTTSVLSILRMVLLALSNDVPSCCVSAAPTSISLSVSNDLHRQRSIGFSVLWGAMHITLRTSGLSVK